MASACIYTYMRLNPISKLSYLIWFSHPHLNIFQWPHYYLCFQNSFPYQFPISAICHFCHCTRKGLRQSTGLRAIGECDVQVPQGSADQPLWYLFLVVCHYTVRAIYYRMIVTVANLVTEGTQKTVPSPFNRGPSQVWYIGQANEELFSI